MRHNIWFQCQKASNQDTFYLHTYFDYVCIPILWREKGKREGGGGGGGGDLLCIVARVGIHKLFFFRNRNALRQV